MKIEKVKACLSAVKRIGERFELKSNVNWKVDSGCPRTSTIKDDHRFKMVVLKDIRKCLLNTAKIQKSKKKFFFYIDKLQKSDF